MMKLLALLFLFFLLTKVRLVSQEQPVLSSAVAFCLAYRSLADPSAIGFLTHFLFNRVMFIVIGFEQMEQIELWMIHNII